MLMTSDVHTILKVAVNINGGIEKLSSFSIFPLTIIAVRLHSFRLFFCIVIYYTHKPVIRKHLQRVLRKKNLKISVLTFLKGEIIGNFFYNFYLYCL